MKQLLVTRTFIMTAAALCDVVFYFTGQKLPDKQESLVVDMLNISPYQPIAG